MIVLYCADAPLSCSRNQAELDSKSEGRSRSRQGKGYAENKLGSEYTVQLVEVESGASIILTIFNQAEEAGKQHMVRYCTSIQPISPLLPTK